MAVLKVIELLAESEKSWEDATAKAVSKASESLNHIRSVYVQNQAVTVKEGKIDRFRVNCKITFEVND